jgi:hypothetical protein
MEARASNSRKPLRSACFSMAWSGALLATLVSVAVEVDARGFGGEGFRGGGGIRGGGSMSMSRGGSSFSRGSYDRGSSSHRSGGTFSRDGSYSRPSSLDNKPSGLDRPGGSGSGTNWGSMTRTPPSGGSASQLPASRPGGGGSGTQRPANRPGGGGSAAQLPANRPGGGGSATQLPADRPGGGGSGTAWRPDCPKCSDGGGGWVDHPIAAGIAIGAIAGAVAIGSTYYYLPVDCPPYYWNDIYYYSCDGVYYQPQYEGDTVVYVTVPDPSGGQQPPTK